MASVQLNKFITRKPAERQHSGGICCQADKFNWPFSFVLFILLSFKSVQKDSCTRSSWPEPRKDEDLSTTSFTSMIDIRFGAKWNWGRLKKWAPAYSFHCFHISTDLRISTMRSRSSSPPPCRTTTTFSSPSTTSAASRSRTHLWRPPSVTRWAAVGRCRCQFPTHHTTQTLPAGTSWILMVSVFFFSLLLLSSIVDPNAAERPSQDRPLLFACFAGKTTAVLLCPVAWCKTGFLFLFFFFLLKSYKIKTFQIFIVGLTEIKHTLLSHDFYWNRIV